MAFAISLWFDETTEAKIYKIWQDFHVNSIASAFHLGSYRPHITAAVCESLDINAFHDDLSQKLAGQASFDLQFSHLGLFLNEPPVLFFGVVHTKPMDLVRERILTSVATFGKGLGPYYHLDNWTPHCTLALTIDPFRLAEAIAICKAQALPEQMYVDRIGVIDATTETERFYIALD